MTDMAPVLQLTLPVLLIGSMLFASLAPPPAKQVALRVRAAMFVLGLLCFGLAAGALAADAVVIGSLALLIASELVCAVGWLSRGEAPGSDDDDGGGGGGGGGRRPKPPPLDWDWDDFESAFQRYARDRVPSAR